MTGIDQGQSERAGPAGPAAGYAEDRCALRWPLWFHSAVPLALAVLVFVLAILAGPAGPLAVLAAVIFTWAVVGMLALRANYRTGIRADGAGIRIGGLRRAERRASRGLAPRRKPWRVGDQRYAVFDAPWTAVHELSLITDGPTIRYIARQAKRSRQRIAFVRFLGRMDAPFMAACLVIYLEPAAARVPAFRPSYVGQGMVKITGRAAPAWLVPTRHPELLRAALTALPCCPPVSAELSTGYPLDDGALPGVPPLSPGRARAGRRWSRAGR